MEKKIIRRILTYIKPYKMYLGLAVLSAIVSTTLTLIAPIIVGRGIDLLIGKGLVDFGKLGRLVVVLMMILLISSFFQWFLSLCINKLTYNTIKDMRIEVFNKLSKVPLGYIDQHAHGDLMSRMVNDIEQVGDGLLQGMTQLFIGVVTIGGTLVLMVAIDVKIALVVVLITPLSLFVATFIGKNTHHLFKSQSKIQGELGGYIEELVGNQKIVKTFGYEEKSQENFEAINGRLYEVGVKAQFFSALTNPCTRFVNGVVYAVVGIIGAMSAIRGQLTIGQMSCFLTYANQYTKPFNEITGVITQLQTALAAAARVFEVLDEQEEIKETEEAIRLTHCGGHLEMKNVSFSYEPKQKLIENLNLVVKPGDKIAIVGPTGCGKTTLINLLMRFYDVDGGEIRIDHTPIKEMTRDSLRSMFGMVLQETWLYSGTIRENIAYGKPEATLEEVMEATKAAHAHSFIKRLPKGYDTLISEAGGDISQGQKQLLCIARMMLIKPPMLILDEATSSIDTMTEIRIQKAFASLMKGRTTFIIAHRLSTIKEADVILVMREGHIVEQGNHQELLARKGFYYKLYHSQFEHV